MVTSPMPVSATSVAAAAAAAAVRADETATQGDAFAMLLQSFGTRMKGASPLDANVIQTTPTPDQKSADTRDAKADAHDDKKADAADTSKNSDKSKTSDKAETKAAAASNNDNA